MTTRPGTCGLGRLAILVVSGCLLTAIAGEPTGWLDPSHLLSQKNTSPVDTVSGWGRWDAPASVFANRSGEVAVFANGAITVPPRSIVVHPGAERDVAIGWRSPIAGPVRVQAKIVHAHPSGGDGVTWAVALVDRGRTRFLASGAIGRGGSQAIPLAADEAKLSAVTVQPGDDLVLVIGPGTNHQCDSTSVSLVISEVAANGRVWDLGRDVSGDIQAGNPHADSLGNSGVWHFLAVARVDQEQSPPRAVAGQRIEAWTIATEDTRLTVGATREGQLAVYDLGNPAVGWNWAKPASVFALPDRVHVGQEGRPVSWRFKDGALSGQGAGAAILTIRFTCDQPALELASVWTAHPGPGPIHHAMEIVNRSERPVTLPCQPSLDFALSRPEGAARPTLWTFHTDGATPDRQGVYAESVQTGFFRRIRTDPNGSFIPYAVLDLGARHGIYLGIEWGFCQITASAPFEDPAESIRLRGGEFPDFRVTVPPGGGFAVPPAFVGAYQGDVDDAGNRLRRFLVAHRMPEIIRSDPGYPKIQWNAFGASAVKPGAWESLESKYRILVDAIAPLGFEEVVLDVGWATGGTGAPEPVGDPKRWPSGMAAAARYAHDAGLRFGLYWNKGEDMASAAGRERRLGHIRRLFSYGADLWRSDSTNGPVVGASYDSFKGFYALLDQLAGEIPNFQFENCVCGGRVKDFGTMRRSVKVFNTDTYAEHHVRQAFYDSSYVFPPAQLMGCLGSSDGRYRPKGAAGMRFAFRTMSLGAPEWFLDSPTGTNTNAPWTDEETAAVKAAVATYKTKIRPLVRKADLYHILPRPDGRNWDGIQYHDATARTGVAILFKPAAGAESALIRFRGVDPQANYQVTFEDGSNPAAVRSGAELLNGLTVTLKGAPVSELVFIQAE